MGLIGRTSTDGSSSAAILDDGTLWVVGANSDGELGLGDTTNRTEWTQLGTDTDWAKVYREAAIFLPLRQTVRCMGPDATRQVLWALAVPESRC